MYTRVHIRRKDFVLYMQSVFSLIWKHWLLGYLIIGGDGVKYTKYTYNVQVSWNVIYFELGLMLKWEKIPKSALTVQKWKV